MYNPTKPYTEDIGELIRGTWDTPWVRITPGTYAVIHRRFDYPEVDHTDGIGTKGKFHWQAKSFRAAVIDALAMNLNDLALMGARAYKLQNHLILPQDNTSAIVELVSALAEECKSREIAITGGETSIHNNADGLDISITVSGFIDKPRENKFAAGEVLIGLRSAGLHSNGMSKVREVLGEELRNDFIIPTRIYSDAILQLHSKFELGGMMHITGGAFTKLKSILGNNDAIIDGFGHLQPQPVFKEIYAHGLSDAEMYTTFNCGVGFILSCAEADVESVLAMLGEGEVIGKIVPGSGMVKIRSAFSDLEITL